MRDSAAKEKKAYTIGMDFGSLSARAVLMEVCTGEAVASKVFPYPHGILSEALPSGKTLPPDWALQLPSDYREAFAALIPALIKEQGLEAEQIIGLGLDVTSTTMLPLTEEGTPLCELPEYKDEPHAYIKCGSTTPPSDRASG